MDDAADWKPTTPADCAYCVATDELKHLQDALERHDFRDAREIWRTIGKALKVIGDGSGISE